MFKRIIIATDLSPASFAVAGCLSALKTYGTDECLLLQCLSFQEAASAGFSYQTKPIEGMVKEVKYVLEQQGFAVEARSVVGPARKEVNRIAVEEDYSLIVVGARSNSLVGEKLLGGVAYGIINASRKPVLVVPVGRKPGEENECEPVVRCAFNDHILFATDFSEMADNAFTYVEQLVAGGVQKVTLLHVQDKVRLEKYLKERLDEFNAIDRARLECLKEAFLKRGTPDIDIEVRFGAPFEEIIRLTEDRGVQLVVMGTQGRSFAGELFLGSVSHNVARSSVAPVLLIPAK